MALTVHIHKYSPVSIVVLGSTKPIKESLKGIGGLVQSTSNPPQNSTQSAWLGV